MKNMKNLIGNGLVSLAEAVDRHRGEHEERQVDQGLERQQQNKDHPS